MKWHRRSLALFASVCIFNGCAVGPPYKRPQSPVPAQWHESSGGETGGDEAAVWPAAQWWHGFGSAKLDELISEAELDNLDLAGAIARVEEADAQVRIAGAPLLPSLDLGATAARERTQITGGGARVFNVFSGS